MIASQNAVTSQLPPSALEFGTSADGFPVVRIGDMALALIPTRDCGFFIASAWRNARPLDELRRDHFYGHDGRVENEAAFRARAIETADHMNALSALSRVQIEMAASTPWGGSQCATIFAEGVTKHATSSHGGFHLSADRNREVDPSVRTDGGWYEEDAEWAIVAVTFPALFTAYERRCADETIRNSWPAFWEKIHGRSLGPGESWSKDRAAFDQLHAGDWVVVSAIQSRDHSGMTEVIATIGGQRNSIRGERTFLVPSMEYAARSSFGFVIDLQRHADLDGPSSFVGRQEGGMMAPIVSPQAQLSRMEDARRQTQRQLERIDRQITGRMTAILPQLARRQTGYRRGKAPDGRTLLERYRGNLAGLTAERQPEVDALTRKLARQDAAIASFRDRLPSGGNTDLNSSEE